VISWSDRIADFSLDEEEAEEAVGVEIGLANN